MKNYNIIFNGAVIQTIKASSFFKDEFGSNAFQDKDGQTFCVIPKEYMIVETEDLTKYEEVLKGILANLESTIHNDKERSLAEFDTLEFWKENFRREWQSYFQKLFDDKIE
jgi:hypothetical protein